ncbi:hypothetical protein ACFQVA_36145 [Actinomadura keratinilytica]
MRGGGPRPRRTGRPEDGPGRRRPRHQRTPRRLRPAPGAPAGRPPRPRGGARPHRGAGAPLAPGDRYQAVALACADGLGELGDPCARPVLRAALGRPGLAIVARGALDRLPR